jgi:hypothetical protein
MLSKLKIVCALEAEGLLREPIHRRHWVHQFNSERETSEFKNTIVLGKLLTKYNKVGGKQVIN